MTTCSQAFERLARRIFQSRLQPFLPWLPNVVFGRIRKWLTWLLRDGCYDGTLFDITLKDIFSEHLRMFGPVELGPSKPTFSGTKVGVVATNIAEDTKTFIFSNFNTPRMQSDDLGRIILTLVSSQGQQWIRRV